MMDREGASRAGIYELYDRYLDALRAANVDELVALFREPGIFRVHAPDDTVESTEPSPLVDRAVERVRAAGAGLDTGLDLYAVRIRRDDAVVLLEEWIDDFTAGRRYSRYALETVVAAGDGKWQIATSSAEETISTLL